MSINLTIALDEAKAANAQTLADVARILRRLFCPHRRFVAPTYISRNGSSKRVYHDAFAEVLEGRYHAKVASMCNRYPMTKACAAAIEERNEHWADVFGVSY